MTIPPATPDMPAVTVTHGVGALVLALRNRDGKSMGTVLHPDAADLLADQLHTQAAHARRLMARLHPTAGAQAAPPPDLPHPLTGGHPPPDPDTAGQGLTQTP